MYLLGDTIVSDTHCLKYKGKWVRVCEHPDAILYPFPYDKPYLYCLNTESKTIQIGNYEFSDWDEINEFMFDGIKAHEWFDFGFTERTILKLVDGTTKKISEIEVGDILYGGDRVYGLVEIEVCDLEKNQIYSQAPSLEVFDERVFHLLTDTKKFRIGEQLFEDYNSLIDIKMLVDIKNKIY
jgi:hypothetical protein